MEFVRVLDDPSRKVGRLSSSTRCTLLLFVPVVQTEKVSHFVPGGKARSSQNQAIPTTLL